MSALKSIESATSRTRHARCAGMSSIALRWPALVRLTAGLSGPARRRPLSLIVRPTSKSPAGRARGGTVNRRLISSGSSFEREIGYSRAVVDGEWIFVSGTTGFDYRAMTISDDVVAQAEQCLRNIQAALAEAGATLGDVVRVVYVVPHGPDFRQCWPVLRKHFGDV